MEGILQKVGKNWFVKGVNDLGEMLIPLHPDVTEDAITYLFNRTAEALEGLAVEFQEVVEYIPVGMILTEELYAMLVPPVVET